MTELERLRLAWLTSAVRGLLKARSGLEYFITAAGQADEEIRQQEAKRDIELGPILLRYFSKKARQAIEDFIKERL